jgi:hypothetical protein
MGLKYINIRLYNCGRFVKRIAAAGVMTPASNMVAAPNRSAKQSSASGRPTSRKCPPPRSPVRIRGDFRRSFAYTVSAIR